MTTGRSRPSPDLYRAWLVFVVYYSTRATIKALSDDIPGAIIEFAAIAAVSGIVWVVTGSQR